MAAIGPDTLQRKKGALPNYVYVRSFTTPTADREAEPVCAAARDPETLERSRLPPEFARELELQRWPSIHSLPERTQFLQQ